MSILKRYLDCMEMDEEYLRGKFILDIGAGSTGFGRECILDGIADVISVEPNPDYSEMSQVLMLSGESTPLIIGLSQRLPFMDEVFDLVVSSLAVPMLCESEEEVRATLEEMCRVVKMGGEIRIADIVIHRREDLENWIGEKIFELFESGDYEIIRFSRSEEMPEFFGKYSEHRLCIIKKKSASR